MKTLILALARIFQYFRHSTFIMILFCIGSIGAGIIAIYAYGNYNQTFNIYTSLHDDIVAQYFATNDVVDDVKNLPNKFDKEIFKNIEVYHYFPLKDYIEIDESKVWYDSSGQAIEPRGDVGFSLMIDASYDSLYKGSKTSPDLGEVILGYNFVSDYSLDENFEFLDKRYKIIGFSYFFNSIVMNIEDFESIDVPISLMRFIPHNEMSGEQIETLTMQMSEVFPSSEFIENSFTEEISVDIIMDFVVIGVIYLMAIFSFVFLVKALIDKNKKENIIYSIHGLSRRRLFSLVIIETVLLNFINLCIACVIHFALYDVFFIHVTQGVARHRLNDYVTIVLFAMAISLVCLIPTFYRYNKQSLMKQKSRG